MPKGNVLVVGNSGVGKSTLINAVLGQNKAMVVFGLKGTTQRLKIYVDSELPFRLIDTVALELGSLKKWEAIGAVKKWLKEAVQKGDTNAAINLIWFCVDGTSSKLFPKTIQNLAKAVAGFTDVPIIVAITKSYSVSDYFENAYAVRDAFAKQKKLPRIISVVTEIIKFDDNIYTSPYDITELIDATNELMPQGLQAAQAKMAAIKLTRKRVIAQGVVGTAVTAGAVIGAVPIPFADAAILVPVEVVLLNSLATIYGINKNDEFKKFIEMLVTYGAVGLAAKAAIGAIKAIPGVGLAASAVNAIVAGCMIAALGESSIFIFEQIALGKKSIKDIAWAREIVEAALDNKFIEKVTKILCSAKDGVDAKIISKMVMELFSK